VFGTTCLGIGALNERAARKLQKRIDEVDAARYRTRAAWREPAVRAREWRESLKRVARQRQGGSVDVSATASATERSSTR
jgi:hypothetical protein